ncbi:purine nucleosidase [Halogranum rubrum]|uniref:Purine nucleosidase n=1 Tax=Halogranum rubrum TaxID=553466 RepID=A0A1I4FAE5_9EURY|nr:nucleoside hydrolase [Halogranum rubrum]SFL14433.1 purine nucleosidase [Halogranum rubrum]
MSDESRRVVVDTDTAGDDTQALLMAVASDRVSVEAVTIVGGNVEFEYEVENAKYTLQLADAEDVPVYEGARNPLVKDHEFADYVHGEGGLGGDLFPDTGIESADGYGPDAIVQMARDNPGELTLLCIGPLTNVALACRQEPELGELLDEVWVMGGAVNTLGNDTPSAEYNFWVDPDAAKVVVDELDVTLVDWGVCMEYGAFGPEILDRIDDIDTPFAEFYRTITSHVREFTREQQGIDAVTQPDSLAAALMIAPELRGEVGHYYVDVDEREGMTRGHSLVDENGVLDEEPNTHVVESLDADRFAEMSLAMLRGETPESVL